MGGLDRGGNFSAPITAPRETKEREKMTERPGWRLGINSWPLGPRLALPRLVSPLAVGLLADPDPDPRGTPARHKNRSSLGSWKKTNSPRHSTRADTLLEKPRGPAGHEDSMKPTATATAAEGPKAAKWSGSCDKTAQRSARRPGTRAGGPRRERRPRRPHPHPRTRPTRIHNDNASAPMSMKSWQLFFTYLEFPTDPHSLSRP